MESVSCAQLTKPWTLRPWHRTKHTSPCTTYTSASSYPDYQGTVVTPFSGEREGWGSREGLLVGPRFARHGQRGPTRPPLIAQ